MSSKKLKMCEEDAGAHVNAELTHSEKKTKQFWEGGNYVAEQHRRSGSYSSM